MKFVMRERVPKLYSNTQKKGFLIFHAILMGILFAYSLVTPYDNVKTLFLIGYETVILIVIAITSIYRKELTESIPEVIRAILLATIAGLVLGFVLYKSNVFGFIEHRELQNLFETNKTIIGEDYYSKYENNKDNITKLRELREKVRIERNL